MRVSGARVVIGCLLISLLASTPSLTPRAASPGLTLEQVRAAYGIDKLMQAGMDGSGQTVAVVATGGFKASDIDTFAKRYQLPTGNIQAVPVGNNPSWTEVNSVEFTMDAEIIDAMAPKATILVFEGPSIIAPQVLSGKAPNVLDAILKDGRASAISLSYDGCDLSRSTSDADQLLAMTKRVHDAGLSLFHGAGDHAAYFCADSGQNTTDPSVAFVVSSPYVTALGGVTLSMTANKIENEVVWVAPARKAGTGGGLSTRFPIPDYQKPFLLVDENPKAMRQIPDAAGDADPASGFAFYCTATKSNGWLTTGGDSATGPLWTGGVALVNQYLAEHLKDLPGGPYRLHGPEDLYTLAQAYAQGKVDKPPFRDITQGNNLVYKARKGYDLTTGIGTPDFYNIALDLEALYRAKLLPVTAP